jgi:hypothetical protein
MSTHTMLTEKERVWLNEMIQLACNEGGPYTRGVEDLTATEVLELFAKLGLPAPHQNNNILNREGN